MLNNGRAVVCISVVSPKAYDVTQLSVGASMSTLTVWKIKPEKAHKTQTSLMNCRIQNETEKTRNFSQKPRLWASLFTKSRNKYNTVQFSNTISLNKRSINYRRCNSSASTSVRKITSKLLSCLAANCPVNEDSGLKPRSAGKGKAQLW